MFQEEKGRWKNYFSLYYLLKLVCYFLDWWNGTSIDFNNQVLVITYRYRFDKYILHIPYDPKIGRRLGIRKDKTTILNYQDGISLLVDAQKMGYEQIKEQVFDD
jgi:hypothetical protein